VDDSKSSRPSQRAYKLQRLPKSVEILTKKFTLPTRGTRQRVTINLDPVANFEKLSIFVFTLRANDCDVVPSSMKRKAFRPNAPISRNRKVLDEKE
jgi:hypothetical protein